MSWFQIVGEPISPGATALENPAAGASVVFEGRVRDLNDGQSVLSLEYEAYGELAKKIGEKIVESALARFEILEASCVHRVGHLQIGEVAIRAEALAAHRSEAFRACEFIVEEVKAQVPIWKREHYVGGASEWINASRGQADTKCGP